MKNLFKNIGISVIVSFLFATACALDLKGQIEAIDLQAKTLTVEGQVYQIDEMTFWEKGIAGNIFNTIKIGDFIHLTFNRSSASGPIHVIKLKLAHLVNANHKTGASLGDVVNSSCANCDGNHDSDHGADHDSNHDCDSNHDNSNHNNHHDSDHDSDHHPDSSHNNNHNNNNHHDSDHGRHHHSDSSQNRN